MVNIYVRKVRAGELTTGDVPARWRDKVEESLNT